MRTFLINIVVFLCLCVAGYFAIPVVDAADRMIAAIFRSQDKRASLPNYANVTWAATHFSEFNNLGTEYVSFIGWRRRPFTGRTINIEPTMQIRHTPMLGPTGNPRSVYFFGGSTMWGTGSDDHGTIPALYQRAAGGEVLNFAESGWTAHQSLNQLIKLYTEGHRPDIVVFYDGYNDVTSKCRVTSNFWAHGREARVRQAVRYWPTEIGYYVQPVLYSIELLQKPVAPDAGNCDSDPIKAALVAEQLVTDWRLAAMLVASYGGRFHAFLQPVAYFSTTRTDKLNLRGALRPQIQSLYPIIRQRMAALPWATDLTTALDQDAYIYIDESHVSPNGNGLIVERMRQIID